MTLCLSLFPITKRNLDKGGAKGRELEVVGVGRARLYVSAPFNSSGIQSGKGNLELFEILGKGLDESVFVGRQKENKLVGEIVWIVDNLKTPQVN